QPCASITPQVSECFVTQTASDVVPVVRQNAPCVRWQKPAAAEERLTFAFASETLCVVVLVCPVWLTTVSPTLATGGPPSCEAIGRNCVCTSGSSQLTSVFPSPFRSHRYFEASIDELASSVVTAPARATVGGAKDATGRSPPPLVVVAVKSYASPPPAACDAPPATTLPSSDTPAASPRPSPATPSEAVSSSLSVPSAQPPPGLANT